MRNIIGGVILGIVGLAAAAFGLSEHRKCDETLKRLDETVDSISSNQQVDIEKAIVDRAVAEAVERKANAMVSNAIDAAREETRTDIRSRIREVVQAEFDRQKPDISGRLAAQAEDIDMDALKKEVTEKAEAAILEKFYKAGGIPKIYSVANGMLNGTGTGGVSFEKISDILDQFTYDSDKKRVLELLLGKDKIDRNGLPW